jgi:hypothetical protein
MSSRLSSFENERPSRESPEGAAHLRLVDLIDFAALSFA